MSLFRLQQWSAIVFIPSSSLPWLLHPDGNVLLLHHLYGQFSGKMSKKCSLILMLVPSSQEFGNILSTSCLWRRLAIIKEVFSFSTVICFSNINWVVDVFFLDEFSNIRSIKNNLFRFFYTETKKRTANALQTLASLVKRFPKLLHDF